MTDNEIIKALECCPLDDIGGCRKTNALFSRINRLKVEIERLKAESILRSGCVPWYDIQETVDNLVKEMTEDEGK